MIGLTFASHDEKLRVKVKWVCMSDHKDYKYPSALPSKKAPLTIKATTHQYSQRVPPMGCSVLKADPNLSSSASSGTLQRPLPSSACLIQQVAQPVFRRWQQLVRRAPSVGVDNRCEVGQLLGRHNLCPLGVAANPQTQAAPLWAGNCEAVGFRLRPVNFRLARSELQVPLQ